MKKTAIILVTLLGVFYACKKEDKTTEPTPVTPVTPTCTTCPYCVIDTAVVDTMPHMIATIDDTIHFVASELHDTIISGGPNLIFRFKGKNTFLQGNPEIEIVRSNGLSTIPITYTIQDSTSNLYMTYKINNTTFHSKKGVLHDKSSKSKQKPPTYYLYMSEYTAFFCFNTDTINGVSHKIKLGSVKVKHP